MTGHLLLFAVAVCVWSTVVIALKTRSAGVNTSDEAVNCLSLFLEFLLVAPSVLCKPRFEVTETTVIRSASNQLNQMHTANKHRIAHQVYRIGLNTLVAATAMNACMIN